MADMIERYIGPPGFASAYASYLVGAYGGQVAKSQDLNPLDTHFIWGAVVAGIWSLVYNKGGSVLPAQLMRIIQMPVVFYGVSGALGFSGAYSTNK